jgi:paired amphipathic helix protein Sin3a
MCWEVLNDEWVSHPTWASEDAGFTTHKKNPYEEALHKSEEERHEYDFHVEAINRTIQVLEPINSRINLMDNEERTHFKLKPGLGGQGKSIYQRVIKKIYGKDHGQEVIAALHDSPSIAVPVVLNRLKQKDDEWKRAQREWNKVWREVDGRNYYKSLDHQGVNFKANDKKNYGPKQLVQEIEAKRNEQSKERAKLVDPVFARTLPKDHYAFKLEDAGVLNDCVKLILTFLDRTNTVQYSRSDKMQIESFLQSFVPTFFMLDSVDFEAGIASVGEFSKVTAVPPVSSASAPRAEDADTDGDGASDGQSPTEDADESTPVASSSSRRGAGSKKGGAHAADLRKKLLKGGTQKSGKGLSAPPSRASPAPGAPSDAMTIDSIENPEAGPSAALPRGVLTAQAVFSTPERESWVKYDLTDVSVKRVSAFKAPARDVPGRKANFFANNSIYVLLRQLQVRVASLVFRITDLIGCIYC